MGHPLTLKIQAVQQQTVRCSLFSAQNLTQYLVSEANSVLCVKE